MEAEISATKAEISAMEAEISATKAKISAMEAKINATDNVAVNDKDSQLLLLYNQQLLALTNQLTALTNTLYHQQGFKELEGNVYTCI